MIRSIKEKQLAFGKAPNITKGINNTNEESIYQFRKELQNLGYCKAVVNSYPKQVAKFLNHARKAYFEIQSSDIVIYYSYLQTIQSPGRAISILFYWLLNSTLSIYSESDSEKIPLTRSR